MLMLMRCTVSFLILLLSGTLVYAQNDTANTSPKKTRVEILGADDFVMEDVNGESVKQLIGNVKLKHDGTLMYCDSANLYSNTNTLKAYGNVIIEGEDGAKLYGDSLNYDGNKKFAKVRGNVKLIDSAMTVRSNMLDFDRSSNVASYFSGGVILLNEGKDTLTSDIGHFNTNTNLAHFKGNVRYRSKDFSLDADTLQYAHGQQKTIYLGPTDIITGDSTVIYTERGWSKTQENISVFYQNAHITTETQDIIADSIFYDNKQGIGEMWRNVFVLDTVEDFAVKGQYGYMRESDEYTRIEGDSAVFIQFDSDTLYLHGDSLIATVDSATDKRRIRAFPNAAFFRKDMQGRCDSLVFSDPDSTIKMFYQPIIWSDANEISAAYIEMLRYDGEIHQMMLQENPLIVSEEDSLHYNQIQGDSMVAYFKSNDLERVKVYGNGNTLYYVKDGSEMVGMNVTTSDSLTIFIDSSTVKDILFLSTPIADLIPPKDFTPSNQKLDRFAWRIDEKPIDAIDIFRRTIQKPSTENDGSNETSPNAQENQKEREKIRIERQGNAISREAEKR